MDDLIWLLILNTCNTKVLVSTSVAHFHFWNAVLLIWKQGYRKLVWNVQKSNVLEAKIMWWHLHFSIMSQNMIWFLLGSKLLQTGGSSASLPKVPFQLRIFEDTHFATLSKYLNHHKIGATYTKSVFHIIILSDFHTRQYRVGDHREDAPHFT